MNFFKTSNSKKILFKNLKIKIETNCVNKEAKLLSHQF